MLVAQAAVHIANAFSSHSVQQVLERALICTEPPPPKQTLKPASHHANLLACNL